MTSVSILEARERFEELLEQVNSGSLILITNNEGPNCYLVSENEYRSMMETIYLSSIPGLVESIRKEVNAPTDEMISKDNIDW